MYCTLEPCCHTGRTGPCAARVADAGVARLVAAMEDPNPLVCGGGFAYLRDRGVDVTVGVGAAEAAALNQPFLMLIRERRPFVILKAATSVDGHIAARRGERTPLTSAAANRHAQRVRAEVDAIGIGSGTLLVDDPQLTARGAYRERPLTRVVFDRRLRTPPTARVLSTAEAGPVIIVTSAAAAGRAIARRRLEDRGAQIEIAADATFGAALARLGARGIGSLLLEGGAALHVAAWDEGLVDFVRLYVTPHVLGTDGVPLLDGRPFASASLIGRRTEPLGADVLIEGYVHGPH
jgi:diaminohydroxyphosphoribosylaminopyrimidine deaminase/5-amino-6-(5-phosphoribosylamino)uracil reductase